MEPILDTLRVVDIMGLYFYKLKKKHTDKKGRYKKSNEGIAMYSVILKNDMLFNKMF